MSDFDHESYKAEVESHEYATVTVMEGWQKAKDCECMLKANDIPAVVEGQGASPLTGRCFAVMVPKDCMEEAEVLIEADDAEDYFYDSLSEDIVLHDEDFLGFG